MASEEFVKRYFEHVDGNVPLYIERLAEAVAIPSVSSNLDVHLPDIQRMMEWAASHIRRLGGNVTLKENPASTAECPLPPILLGEFLVDPKKKTVCVYGHLDVQPAKKEDGWNTDPFVLTEVDEKLFGRGSTDDKGPVLSWLWVIEAHQALGVELPVNVKLLFEGMEEFGSEGLAELVHQQARQFLKDVDFFCISDNYWIGKTTPCITYGLRGIAYFTAKVTCGKQDLHSGIAGGAVHEAMTDLVHLLSSLVGPGGKITIDGIMDDVAPVTKEEEALYETLDFKVEEFRQDCNLVKRCIQDDPKSLLMARWRYPSLSLHGVEGAFSGPGAKTVIPAAAMGHFSMRLVPNQDPARVQECVEQHLQRKFAALQSPNELEVQVVHVGKPWLSDWNHPNYQAAARATEKVYGGRRPDFTREGGSIPITQVFEEATQMNCLLLPVGACDDMAHSQNEKFNKSCLINAIKVLGLYLHELGALDGPKPSSCRCEPLSKEELMEPGAFIRGFRCKCEI